MTRSHDLAAKLYEAARTAFVESSCGMGLGDRKRTNDARLFHRYATADQNRADKLEKRLGILKRNRSRHRQADAMEIKYEPRYMNTRPEDLYVDPANDCMNEEHQEIQPEPVEKKPQPTRPKYTLEQLAEMVRETIKADMAGEMGVSIAAKSAATGDPLPGDENEPEYARVNWANSRSVKPEELEMMENLSMMDEGPEQASLVKRYFGTQENVMKAYNAYYQVPGC